jgi:Nucleotidyl transferase AbiEii toxin, Type IV TA system
MLHYETVTHTLLEVLKHWQNQKELSEFRLVGGTALSLYFGHRMSDDIDLFSLNENIDEIERKIAPTENIEIITKSKFHIAGFDKGIKINFTYWNLNFEEFDTIDGIKMASLMDILG